MSKKIDIAVAVGVSFALLLFFLATRQGTACEIALLVIDIALAVYAISLRRIKESAVDYVNILLDEKEKRSAEPISARGARLAISNSGAVEFANEWVSAMPSNTARDFVVRFDGWDEDDWTMWIRMPWGKYKENKAEIDFALGRNVIKENFEPEKEKFL